MYDVLHVALCGHYRQLYCEMGEQDNVLCSQCVWTGHMITLLYVNMSVCLCIITIIITAIIVSD